MQEYLHISRKCYVVSVLKAFIIETVAEARYLNLVIVENNTKLEMDRALSTRKKRS